MRVKILQKLQYLTIFAFEMEDLNLDIFNLLDNQPQPSRGSMLVAKPTVEDFCFKRSVTLIVDHDNEEGSMGFMINKPTRFTINEVAPELECNVPLPLYLGGPVGTNMLFFLHSIGSSIPESLQVAPGLFYGGDFDMIKMYLESCEHPEDKVKFMVGYSGWAKGQLDEEVSRHDWALLKENAAQLVFNTPDEHIWQEAVNLFGQQYRMWQNWPDDIYQN